MDDDVEENILANYISSTVYGDPSFEQLAIVLFSPMLEPLHGLEARIIALEKPIAFLYGDKDWMYHFDYLIGGVGRRVADARSALRRIAMVEVFRASELTCYFEFLNDSRAIFSQTLSAILTQNVQKV